MAVCIQHTNSSRSLGPSVRLGIVTETLKEEKWIGLSDFQQQHRVNGKVSTAQTWLAHWLDDKL